MLPSRPPSFEVQLKELGGEVRGQLRPPPPLRCSAWCGKGQERISTRLESRSGVPCPPTSVGSRKAATVSGASATLGDGRIRGRLAVHGCRKNCRCTASLETYKKLQVLTSSTVFLHNPEPSNFRVFNVLQQVAKNSVPGNCPFSATQCCCFLFSLRSDGLGF